jgi:hypothetical protein
MPRLFLAALASCLCATPAVGAAPRMLVVLEDTGQQRNGLPVFRVHPQAAEVAGLLDRGFAGRMLRLYQLEQEYLRQATGSRAEPAYLLLSNRQGGFPGRGFFLEDQEKRDAGFVDLHRSTTRRGRFGSMDQIFPHELAHVIMRQLAGEPPEGGSNQLHAVGVRTDPFQAFSEGFAEHLQVMAVDDPDADPATRLLAGDDSQRELAIRVAQRYRSELTARFAPAGPARMGFLVWYSGTEQMWRYAGVKANAFAHVTPIDSSLLEGGDLYAAYLLQNSLPGDLQAPAKPASVMLATEGVVSTLFYRWATTDPIRQSYRDDGFYARFGAARSRVSLLENAYLKIFHVLFVTKAADTASFVRNYRSIFPDEAAPVDALVREVFLGQPLPDAPAIWLANRAFQTGTSLFDQFRILPRIHTFDLNAATMVDLLGVPGMRKKLAEKILGSLPYHDLEDLNRLAPLPPGMMNTFAAMRQEMQRLAAGSEESEAGLSLGTIFWSYGRRALVVLALTSLLGTILYSRVRPARRWRSGINGLAASALALGIAWLTSGTPAVIALSGPVILFGLPAALMQLIRRRAWLPPARALLAWACAALPAVLAAYLRF